MDEKILTPAEHYYDINRFDEAYQKLSTLDLVIDRQEQIEHHILLSLVLNGLGRYDEAESIADTLLSKFPDNYRCQTHWISLTCDDHRKVERSYEFAQSLRKDHPTDYWLPYIMAKMAYSFRLHSSAAIVSLSEEAVSLYRNQQTLQLAYIVYTEFGLHEKAKSSLDELVENFPETESTYDLLLSELERKDDYSELSQVSYNAIRKFPHNEAFTEYYEHAVNQRYGSFLDKLVYFALKLGDSVIIERSSTKLWFRALQMASTGLGTFVIVATATSGVLLYLLGMVFFLHYTVFASDDRHINKQRKKRLLKREFEHNDQMVEATDGASVLVASTHLKYQLLFLDDKGVILAEDAFCMLEELHINFDVTNLKGVVRLPRDKIKSIEVSTNYLTLKTKRLGLHMVYFEHLPTLEFVIEQLERHGYYLVETRKGSRLLLTLGCFFGAKAGLGAAFFTADFTSWQIGAVFALAVLSNTTGFFIYRLIHPSSTDIYISSY
ncbi:MAG: tetratricopeptide repeat protein [Candidatus Thiodiazotropha sp.]